MTADQLAPAQAAAGGWPHFQLGDWRVRPTTVLIKRRRDVARVFFLLPPPGFSSSARLGVIDGSRREEFFHSWSGDRPRPGRDLRSGSTAAGDAGRAPDDAPTPMPFSVRLAQPAGFAQADLLLEVPGQARVTGALALPPLRLDAGILHLLPIAPPPAGDPETGPAAPRAPGQRESLIDALLGLARRDPALRLAVPGDWAGLLRASPRAERARELTGEGRLDLLVTPGTDPEAVRALALPLPPRVALRIGDQGLTRMWPDLRALILVPHAEPATCAAGAGEAAGTSGATGGTFVVTDATGPYVLIVCGHWIRGRTFGRGHEASVCAVCDHAVRRGIPVEPVGPRTPLETLRDSPPGTPSLSAIPEAPGRRQVLACLPVCLDHRDAWKHLAGDVRRWNRSHISPRLQILTPADHVAQLEQLHEEGSVRLAGLGGAP